VTDPEMERYFMTSTEAVFLILNALVEGRDGDTLVLDMGKRIRLLELAQAVARLAGIEPDADIPIVFVGPRPGEKAREELVGRNETVEPTGHDMIWRVRGEDARPNSGDLREGLEVLDLASRFGSRDGVRWLLEQLVPTYAPASVVFPVETTTEAEDVLYGVGA
jgi:FlaA1/EpsC-like NDP-sugar epimerase